MLSPTEFTVGTLGDAAPLSLVLPRTQYEEIVIIGHIDGEAAAVFLSGQYAFRYFRSSGNQNWGGIIIPDVRIEVDEATVYDPSQRDTVDGSVLRSDTRLLIHGRSEQHSYGQFISITLHDNLAAAQTSAGFTKWQVVIGRGPDKRVLWRTPESTSG